MKTVDLTEHSVTELNQALHQQSGQRSESEWQVTHPKGAHNVAVGLDAELSVDVIGHVGYFCGGMNKSARITVHGNAGQGVGENMMSGQVWVKGNVSQAAGATAHGGLLVVDGDAGARCGISMKGVDIVVKGDVGHMSCFMGQSGTLVVCGDAGEALGDSLYEVHIYVKGTVKSLGADCVEKTMGPEHLAELSALLQKAGIDDDPKLFTRYGSARNLYNFKVDNAAAY